jgi:hypothetical protein
MKLIGQRVNLVKATDIYTHHDGTVRDLVSYRVDDPAMVENIAEAYPTYRLCPPGAVHIRNYDLGRANIHIDASGLITEVSFG